MHTFIMGIIFLILGGWLYGNICERAFRPDDRKTPAYAKNDGVDYVPLPKWKNALINLLNIAGTGPILGPIQGILFGPIAFITIPIGCVIGGAVHDYLSGMISVREGGIQMPELVRRTAGKWIHKIYTVFVCLVLFLIGVVFIYTPGDIAATQLFGFGGTAKEPSTWVIYGVIFVYYLIASVFPIDKIIGRIYPLFGAVLILSAIGIFAMLLTKNSSMTDLMTYRGSITPDGGLLSGKYILPAFLLITIVILHLYHRFAGRIKDGKATGIYFTFGLVLILTALAVFAVMLIRGYDLVELWDPHTVNAFNYNNYFESEHFIPVFFVTVACGILSGFHSTQITLVTRTLESEKEGRTAFYNMMIAEGFIAMVWAAGTMAMISLGAEEAGITIAQTDAGWSYLANVNGVIQPITATSVVGVVCKNMLGPVGGMIAVIGVIILPVTSGDTALRSMRLILADTFGIKQDSSRKRLLLALPVFAAAFLVLIWAKIDPNGFNTIWRYFGWSNQTLAVFALAAITIWMMQHDRKKFMWLPVIPLSFYAFITCSYLLSSKIGLGLSHNVSIIGGLLFALTVTTAVVVKGNTRGTESS